MQPELTKKIEKYLGIALLIVILILGGQFATPKLGFFWLVGIGFGYALSRGYTGFAGSVNRSYKTGSTRLMRAMMLMFFVTAVVGTGILYNTDVTKMDLWVNQINLGLILGGILFGFGMAFSSCCASGVLTDIVTALPRGFITLVFFGLGVFVGFPVQKTATWITESWFSSETGLAIGTKGVYMPDLFKNDGFNGYLGAIILTGILCTIVTILAYMYEKHRKQTNTYTGHFVENMQIEANFAPERDSKTYKFWSKETYDRVFVKPWSLVTAGMVIAAIFVMLRAVAGFGWGASTPYGLWFGRVLLACGVDINTITEFTHWGDTPFIMPFFEHPVYVQNIGILVGTILFLLTSGTFTEVCRGGLKITAKEAFFYAIGGITMGFGTRLANGCNVGALYTPIADFSVSGWVFLAFLVAGGIIGNKVAKIVKL